ncbi:hypothetical protein [Deinococcus soli (ex Cha et al. 2016)]|uniref:Uncharacterized protein n=2 Tax=Deinococcus soli (ex Cha et al. 2016) TaxID=1309411 RepID=A0AAE3XE63_9DEIO|nr:hypothetical protein [Deinococcus soli (ex Cha et al. 2016)]MDR6218852.1 hypothetical protein [Deinococcus soli (ex Cha et al. 2016)]MDR6328649.1 hypothetical protein [Deinococcus soli (ex Cha et al. 2016)]MDR6751864.1 hypothetical protein [Deinococcus soli (ex Cha et al. 2016)]
MSRGPLHEYKDRFTREYIHATPPPGCPLRVGDRVTVINAYGVPIVNRTVMGFTRPGAYAGDRCVYLDWDCYWYPARAKDVFLYLD